MCFKPKGLPPPNNLKSITNVEIIDILKPLYPNTAFFISDRYYNTIEIEELLRFLKDDKTNEYRYIADIKGVNDFDCDDFSFRLIGAIHDINWGSITLAKVWLQKPDSGHAMNLFIDSNHEVWLVEPQNDTYFHCPQNWIPYFILFE